MFACNPFAIVVAGTYPAMAKAVLPSINEAAFQLELVQIQRTDELKVKFEDVGLCDCVKMWDFWVHSTHRYPNCRKLAIFLLTMFGSTYTCELGSSTMNLIKNKNCSRLTHEHLNQCMQLALTSDRPVFIKLALNLKCLPLD